MRLGEMVKQAREALGLTVLDVSQHIPLDDRYLRQIEASTVVPGSLIVFKISSALKLDPQDMERQRRVEYAERDFSRNRSMQKMPLHDVKVAAMSAKTKSDQPIEEKHKCEADPLLAKGHHRICVTVPPQVWSALEEITKDMYAFSGVEPTLRSMINTVILSVYEFKKNQPDKFEFKLKDFGEKK